MGYMGYASYCSNVNKLLYTLARQTVEKRTNANNNNNNKEEDAVEEKKEMNSKSSKTHISFFFFDYHLRLTS